MAVSVSVRAPSSGSGLRCQPACPQLPARDAGRQHPAQTKKHGTGSTCVAWDENLAERVLAVQASGIAPRPTQGEKDDDGFALWPTAEPKTDESRLAAGKASKLVISETASEEPHSLPNSKGSGVPTRLW